MGSASAGSGGPSGLGAGYEMGRVWMPGDYVRLKGTADRMVVTGFADGKAVCLNGVTDERCELDPESLEPAPYHVKSGIIFDEGLPVGLFPGHSAETAKKAVEWLERDG